MQHIGIFGGSFNPIHTGHIALARQLLALAGLDAVWLMVSPRNPLKPAASLLDDATRLNLARRAVQGVQGVSVCDREFALPRPSYTWDTLAVLSAEHPDCRFTLLIGADNWACFHLWRRADDLLRHYDVAVYPRAGSPVDAAALPPRVRLVPARLLDISSTEVRRRLACGQSIAGMVPECVRADIERAYEPKP